VGVILGAESLVLGAGVCGVERCKCVSCWVQAHLRLVGAGACGGWWVEVCAVMCAIA
jgi:hypothetical protein